MRLKWWLMMSEKRYFKVEYDEEWYLFDSNTISEELVKEQAEYGYGVFANSLSPSEICELLNEQQAAINELQDTVYDELDKALKVLEEIYEDYPKNNVQRLYNNLKGLKEMIR